MITGHNWLNYHEWKVQHEHGNNKCRFCELEPETSFHLIGKVT